MVLIIIACVGISAALLLKYFYFGNGGSKYGDRLDGIEAVAITDDKKIVLSKISNKEKMLRMLRLK